MKFCLSSKQSSEYIKQADEINFLWNRQEDDLFNVIEINPTATITLTIPEDIELNDIDWNKFEQYKKITKNNFKLCVAKLSYMKKAKQKEINFFPKYDITDYLLLHEAIALGACEVRISGELGHDLDNLKNFPIGFRIYPNAAKISPYLPALFGTWVRPEDLDKLPAITICEFSTSLRREQALFRIYSKKEEWTGVLDLLLEDGDESTKHLLNSNFQPNFQERRNNCRFKCLRTDNCHWCEINAQLASEIMKEKIKEKLNKKE